MIDLEELKRLHAAATPGEWRNKDTAAWAHPTAYVESVDCGHNIARLSLDLTCTVGKYEREVENATYIAAIHNAFPAIVAKLEAAQRLRDALQILHDENMDYIKLNNLGAENNQSLRMAREALAAFDKEQQ